ncbi:MAG: hypothetical protein ACI31R_01905 [Bacilli bacterium]
MFKKLIKELKQNKFTTIVFCIFLGLFLVGWLLFGLVMPKNGEPVYGNRLDGIEDVKVTDEQTSELVKELKSKDYVTNASTHISGRIINVIVETKKGTKTSTAKTLRKVVLETFDDDQIDYYDFQLFLKNEDDSAKGYPLIGYKNSTDKDFAF